MKIESWNQMKEGNPAWRSLSRLREWVSEQNLDPNTVKTFSALHQIIPQTALSAVQPIHFAPRIERLTPFEKESISGNPPKIAEHKRIAIVDIDGVLVSVWPAFDAFLNSKSGSLEDLKEAINLTKPHWTSLRPLGEIGRRVDQLILWTSRISLDENSLRWKMLKSFFGSDGSLPNVPFLTDQTSQKIEKRFFPGKTRIVSGLKEFNENGFAEIIDIIEKARDPYVVYVGSSIFDIKRFKAVINHLRKKELPFDRFVFFTNCHLIL